MSDYREIDSNGNEVVVESNGKLDRFEAISDDTTLTVVDSGKIFLLDAIGEVITLPSPTKGVNYKFICQVTTATSNWTIVSATKVIYGSASVVGAAVPASAENTVNLVQAKFLPGDWVTLKSDGTNWYVYGCAVTSGGITFTDT